MLMRFSIVFILVVSLQACFETPQKLTTVKHVKLPVNMPIDATFSQNGKMLALLTLTELSLWQTENHTLLAHYKLPKQDNLMRFMAMSETANRLVVADSSTVYLFKLSDLTPLTDWPVSGFSRDAKITAINLSDDGLHVFVGLNEGSLLHVNLRARQQSLYQLHQSDISYIAPKLIESTLITASYDGTVNSLNLISGDVTTRFTANSRITSLVLSKNKQLLFYSDALSQQQVATTNTWQTSSSLSYLERFKHFREGYFYSSNLLVTASPKSEFYIWNLCTGKTIATGQIRAHSMGSKILSISSNHAKELLTISSDGELQWWHLDRRIAEH